MHTPAKKEGIKTFVCDKNHRNIHNFVSIVKFVIKAPCDLGLPHSPFSVALRHLLHSSPYHQTSVDVLFKYRTFLPLPQNIWNHAEFIQQQSCGMQLLKISDPVRTAIRTVS